MPLMKLTRELAFAASLDAGNRAMRAAGRKKWSRADQLVATREFNRLWPLCPHLLEPESWCPTCDGAPETTLPEG
jgi:hypothetical protein